MKIVPTICIIRSIWRDFVKGIDTIIRKIFIPKDIRDEFEEEGY